MIFYVVNPQLIDYSPASIALRAAILKSSTMKGISLALSCLGVGLAYTLSSGATQSQEQVEEVKIVRDYTKRLHNLSLTNAGEL